MIYKMHRLFTIPELVDVVVHCLAPRNDTAEPRSTAAPGIPSGSNLTGLPSDTWRDVTSLGLTASLFRESALNAIWHTQHSLLPLLRSVDVADIGDDQPDGRYVRRPAVR